MQKLKSPEFVWLGVVSLFQFAQKYTAALKAYGEIYGDNGAENAFIDISYEALWRQLMSELSKTYDTAQTLSFDNLSMKQLRKVCAGHPIFQGEEGASVIKQLDDLQTRYEELLSKNLRNKKLAHYDLISAFTQEALPIPFSEIEQFVIDTSSTLNAVGKLLLLGELSIGYEAFADQYRNDLIMLAAPKQSN